MLVWEQVPNSNQFTVWYDGVIDGVWYPSTLDNPSTTDAYLAERRLYRPSISPPAPGLIIESSHYERINGIVTLVFVTSEYQLTEADVQVERDKRIDAGFIFMGKPYQSRPQDRENILGVLSMAGLASVMGKQPGDYHWHLLPGETPTPENEFKWITEDNEFVPMDAPTCFAFASLAAKYKDSLIKAARDLKDNMPVPIDYINDRYWPSKTIM